MKVSVIAIGDELLIGQVIDTNSSDIAKRIAPYGWELDQVQVVHDQEDAILDAIDRALSSSQIVITTGGLGPTKDDITKGAMLKYFGGELVRNEDVTANIEEIFARRGVKINSLTADQALVPTSCTVIQNVLGTAPIMWFEKDGKVLVAMPGVPFETRGMLDREVVPRLVRKFAQDQHVAHRNFMCWDITESDLAIRLEAFEESLPKELHLAYLPQPGLIRLRLDGHSSDKALLDELMDKFSGKIVEIAGENLIYEGDANAAQILLHYLKLRGLTVGSAESCTGGAIASAITRIPGASDFFMGSVVSYSNQVKMNLLGVRQEDLEAYGAVSESVVRQMAEGSAKALGVDCTMATSGIAGPGGGTAEKPVGTVWMAVHTPEGTVTRCHHFSGDRQRVIERATNTALLSLANALRKM